MFSRDNWITNSTISNKNFLKKSSWNSENSKVKFGQFYSFLPNFLDDFFSKLKRISLLLWIFNHIKSDPVDLSFETRYNSQHYKDDAFLNHKIQTYTWHSLPSIYPIFFWSICMCNFTWSLNSWCNDRDAPLFCHLILLQSIEQIMHFSMNNVACIEIYFICNVFMVVVYIFDGLILARHKINTH